MASVQEAEENFAEDECTIEFGDEEPQPGVVGGPRFVEYPGEDFSKYLSDTTAPTPVYDNGEDQVPQSDTGTRRRYIRKNQNAKSTTGRSRLHRPTSSMGAAQPPPPPPNVDNSYMIPDGDLELSTTPTAGSNMIPPPASPPAARRKSGNTIRERVGRLLTKGQPGQRPRSQSADRLSVQNFTFADSKIGTMMLAQREQEQALQAQQFADDPSEEWSELDMAGSRTWWDVGTLSWNSSVRLRENGNAKSDRRHSSQDVFTSVPDLSGGPKEDRRSLIGSISKAMHSKARARRGSDAVLPSSPSSQTTTSSDQPSSAAARSTTSTTTSASSSSLRSKDSQPQDGSVRSDGKGTRRGKLFQRLMDGVGSRAGKEQTPTTRRGSESNAVSAPRYTRIYDEVNHMTTDFRQSTVDNPVP